MNLRVSVLLLMVCLAAPCLGGQNLSIRLVEASNKERGILDGLQDITNLLKQDLTYKSYTAVATASLKLPARNVTKDLGDYSITCSGQQTSLAITVVKRRSQKEVLKTTVNLRDNKPLIVGGFPSKGGKMILVFVAK